MIGATERLDVGGRGVDGVRGVRRGHEEVLHERLAKSAKQTPVETL